MEPSARPVHERRHHKLFITCNTEYHLRDVSVVAVRKRGEEQFLSAHEALGMVLTWEFHEPGPGDRLLLVNPKGEVLVSSSVVAVERPPLEAVKQYPPKTG